MVLHVILRNQTVSINIYVKFADDSAIKTHILVKPSLGIFRIDFFEKYPIFVEKLRNFFVSKSEGNIFT